MEHLHAYVPEDQARRLREHAAANDRSLAGEMRRMVRLYCALLDRQSVQQAPPGSTAELAEPMLPA